MTREELGPLPTKKVLEAAANAWPWCLYADTDRRAEAFPRPADGSVN